MNIFKRAAGLSWPRLGKQMLVSLLSLGLLFAAVPPSLLANQDAPAPPPAAAAPPYTQQGPEELQRSGSADCAVSGFAGGADPGRVHLSRASGGG